MTAGMPAYQIGWDDGYETTLESGSADPGPGGWAGRLLGGADAADAAYLLAADPNDAIAWAAALSEYDRGAKDGAAAALLDLADVAARDYGS